MRIAFLVHYFPPINSSGAKRVEAVSKFLAAAGHEVTVITDRKRSSDGGFTERVPSGVTLMELSAFGRIAPSRPVGGTCEPMYMGRPSWKRRTKDRIMRWCGQLPDPRLPFALSIGSPWLAAEVQTALRRADVVIGSSPPWPMLLAALIAKHRFGVPCILDYRDQFSECHEMPGGRIAKWVERIIDQRLAAAADYVVTVSEPMARYYGAITDRVHVILNGFDPELMAQAQRLARPHNRGRVVIRYMGLVSPGRVPHRFFEALVRLREKRPDELKRLRLEFFGNADLIARAVEERYPSLKTIIHYEAPVSYLTSIQRIVEADYLLFAETSSTASLSAQGILTTKLLEYIGSGRPVLADIAPETLAGALLRQCGTQHVVTDSVERFMAVLLSEAFFQRVPDHVSAASVVLSRRTQAEEYATLAARIVRGEPMGHLRDA